MATLWPWLALAALGALHGLSPANGWLFAAACGVRAHDPAQTRRALLPIALGHGASVAMVAGAVAWGLSTDFGPVRTVGGALLVGAALVRLLPGRMRRTATGARGTHHAGIALWSFLMATAHGAGLMLVPALVPLCLGANPAREITASGSWMPALAAVGVHLAAMLATTSLVAAAVCRGLARRPRLMVGPASERAWTAALGVSGALLLLA